MKHLFLFLCLFTTLNATAQPAIQWQKAYGGSKYESVNDAKQTNDGGYILIGRTESNDGDITGNKGSVDVWVVKISPTGTIEWQRTYGGSGQDYAGSIEQTRDSGYIFIATTNSNDVDIKYNHGNDDIWVVRLRKDGSIKWQRTYGGSYYDNGATVHETFDGGYIFLGNVVTPDGDITSVHGSNDLWVVGLNDTGGIKWQKSYGGSGMDFGSSIEQTRDSGYIISGQTSSNDGDITTLIGGPDAWIVKINDTGKIVWQNTYGGSAVDEANIVHQTADGGYIWVAWTNSNDKQVTGLHGSEFDIWVVKTNQAGVITWSKTLGGSMHEDGFSVIETRQGNYVITGITKSNDGDVTMQHDTSAFDMWVISLDRNGNMQWQKTIGGTSSDAAYNILQTSDSGYLVCGRTTSVDGDAASVLHHGLDDMFIVKLGSALNINGLKNATANITIYPSPTSGIVNITLPTVYQNATISVLNTLGQLIPVETHANGLTRTLQITGQPAGLYLLQVVNNGAVNIYKVVYQP